MCVEELTITGCYEGFVEIALLFQQHCMILFGFTPNTACDSQGKQVFLGELQVIVVAKPSEHSPRGLMPPSLDKESVQEQETWQEKSA